VDHPRSPSFPFSSPIYRKKVGTGEPFGKLQRVHITNYALAVCRTDNPETRFLLQKSKLRNKNIEKTGLSDRLLGIFFIHSQIDMKFQDCSKGKQGFKRYS
jgi:hypothetical protein